MRLYEISAPSRVGRQQANFMCDRLVLNRKRSYGPKADKTRRNHDDRLRFCHEPYAGHGLPGYRRILRHPPQTIRLADRHKDDAG